MFPAWTWIVGFFVGSAIGSFLNAVIYRLPRMMTLSEPTHSICPNCRHRLGWGELVPLFSWLFQKGKCKHCSAPISPRYFFVELITGSLWAAIWYQQLVVTADDTVFVQADAIAAVGYMLFSAAIVVAIFTDLAHYIIPDEVNAFMLLTGFGMNIAYAATGNEKAWMWGMPSSVAGALVGLGVLWGITFLGRVAFGKDAMGHGDIKMARGIGAVLLPMLAMISFGLAVVLGAVFGILMIALRPKPKGPGAEVRGDGSVVEADVLGSGDAEEEEEYVPESIGSLLKSLVGYLLLMDNVGLVFPKVYLFWFGEDPREAESIDEEFEVEPTMIPFGPYLAVGALLAMFFSQPLVRLVTDYWENMTGAP